MVSGAEAAVLGGSERDRYGFRRRIREVSRLEGFSDAVFGMALALLVVSLDAPRNFEALLDDLKGFVAFGLCFALFLQIWHEHHLYFRRYDLSDALTVTLNGALLLVVLAYVYPLRFLATLLTAELTGIAPRAMVQPVIRQEQVPELMYLYGAGFAAVSLLVALLYVHAWTRRTALGLDALERHATLVSAGSSAVLASVGLLSILLTAVGSSSFWAGMVYMLIGPAMWAYHSLARRHRRRLERRSIAAPAGGGEVPTGAP